MRIHPVLMLLLFLVSVAVGASLPAQRVISDPDRQASTVALLSAKDETVAVVSVSCSRPVWRDGYDAMLETLKGAHYTMLGNGWWSTLDTIGPIDIGGVRIPAGSFFLGLSVGQDGAFHLLLFESRKTMKAGLLPGTTALYRGLVQPDFKAPLTFAKGALAESVPKLTMAITSVAENPSTPRFSIRWGKHELTAPVTMHVDLAKGDTSGKK